MVKINNDILFLYSENAREKIKDIAAALKKTPQRIKYSLNIFKKEKIIHSPYCVFDYSYFGLILFRVYFKGGYISERDKKEIINKLNENSYIVSMYELSGEFDLAIEIESPNPSKFNKEIKRVANLIPTLNNYKIILNLVTHLYPRSHLTKNSQLISNMKQEIIIGGDRTVEEFSENEMLVMKNLLENPQVRLASLAKIAGMNIKTVSLILKNLKKRRIIRGFKYILDTNKLDLYRIRLFLRLHNLSNEREAELMKHMFQTKEIVRVNKTVGDWDMEVDIESIDKPKIRQLIIELRENFKEIIESFNSIEFYQNYKITYLPRYLFQAEEGR